MAKNNVKSLPLKKIFITLLIVLGIILLTLYFYKWHQVKQDEKYLKSYLISTSTINLEMNDISEINTVLSESPSYYFIYISYTKDEDTYNLEKELKPIITEYDLRNNFYFINVTDIKDKNSNYKEDIAKELGIDKNKINNVPVILYFKDGKLARDGVTNANDFEKILKEEDISSK